LGRQLYFLPAVWTGYDEERKAFAALPDYDKLLAKYAPEEEKGKTESTKKGEEKEEKEDKPKFAGLHPEVQKTISRILDAENVLAEEKIEGFDKAAVVKAKRKFYLSTDEIQKVEAEKLDKYMAYLTEIYLKVHPKKESNGS
jgi:hypothetical protein